MSQWTLMSSSSIHNLWQAAGAVSGMRAEPDLPTDTSASASTTSALPPAQLNCAVALTDCLQDMTSVTQMHRIPFWLASDGGAEGEPPQHRAVVLYVRASTPAAAQFFPAVSHKRQKTAVPAQP